MPVIEVKKKHIKVVSAKTADGWCVIQYPNHPHGCPNYKWCKHHFRKKVLLDEFFDLEQPMFIAYVTFDLHKHEKRMKKLHPEWTRRQCRNLRYWQKHVDNRLSKLVAVFRKKEGLERHWSVGEGFGLNMYATCRNAGLILEPIKDIHIVRKLALIIKPKMNFELRNLFRTKGITL